MAPILSGDLVTPLLAASAVFGGVMAGFFFAYSASVVPALETLPGDAYAATMQPINERIRNAAFGVAFFGALAVPAACAAVVALRGDWAAQYGRLFLAGVVVYAIGSIAVTVLVHFPMNDAIATWDPASPPDDWAATRTRWARWNHVRTAAAIVSFVLYVGALASLGG